MEFKGKVVVITGGAQGIGQATALAFAREGASVCLIDLKTDRMADTLEKVKFFGGTGIACHADVSSKAEVDSAIAQALKRFDRIDVLVNNAGVLKRALVEETTKEHWDLMLGVNLLGVVYCSQAVLPTMKKTGGAIINCSSILGTFPNTGSAAYGIAKQGVSLLTRVMAAELAPYSIRVNCYSPGVANTEFAADVITNRGAEKVQQIALHRFGEPEDLADVILFLASDKARYVTGQTLGVDGGMWVTQTPTKTWKEVLPKN